MNISFTKSMTYYLVYCGLLTQLLGNSYTKNIEGKYCQPDCDKPVSYLLFNSDSSFSLHTMLYGGISRYGNWEFIEENKIQIHTNKSLSPSLSISPGLILLNHPILESRPTIDVLSDNLPFSLR